MEKRSDAQIYMLGYEKPEYDLLDNELYTPIECGSLLRGKQRWLSIGDGDSPDNISEMNHFYAETSGTYWIWKNRPSTLKYIGQCQYRRWLWFDTDVDFDVAFSKSDIILPVPCDCSPSVRFHYECCHNINDLNVLEDIVKDKFPDYYNAFEFLMRSDLLFYSAGFIMRAEDFDEYCNFLFGALSEFRSRLGLTDMKAVDRHVAKALIEGQYGRIAKRKIEYQRLIGGFLAERILSAYALSKFKKHMIVPYKLMESNIGI